MSLNSFSRFSVNVRVGKQFTRFSMKPVLLIVVILFLAAVGCTQPLADPNQNQLVNDCAKESSLVYEEKGDYHTSASTSWIENYFFLLYR